MEAKQTQIPLSEILNKKWVAILITVGAFVLIMGGLYLLGGESHDPEQVYQVARQQYCEAEKTLAHTKMRQHVESPDQYPLSSEKLLDLDQKQSKNCEGSDSIIPTAKALSFDPDMMTPVKVDLHPVMIKGSPSQQQYIDYAWNTYHDKNLVYLMKAENGLITPDRQHSTAYYCPGKKGVFHDWGFGGISDCYHPEIVKDSRFFSDPQWQIDQVYNLYKGGTKFASRPKWASMKQYFQWI